MIKTKKGLDLPIAGVPEQTIEAAHPIRTAAVLGEDYPGMKPTMAVREGDVVKRGGLLFTDKQNDGVRFTSPVAGRILGVNRGAKRALMSVTIEVDGDDAERFLKLPANELGALSREQIVENLVTSGLWTALRTRPYSKVPAIDSAPASLFVTAMDTAPLAADPVVVIEQRATEFAVGLDILAKLTEGPVYVCQAAGRFLPSGENTQVQVYEFSGPHPAGLPGTHIHFLDPVGPEKTVWFINYQDVIAVGAQFLSGELVNERVIALGGPVVAKPRLLRTVLGASTDELTAGELEGRDLRVISGSVLSGRMADGPEAFLGRYHNQVSVLAEDRKRRFIGFLAPGLRRHSVTPTYFAWWLGKKDLIFNTSTNGSARAMVPIGSYEKVM
ncbi:MAG: Na(+)-translocating NADH-quinone reductase subunit A, partial [Pseudomonadales bacterium]|nr:Na(+)-translocating NADH-quinone reductase subunit A [Pseudomonadales bacterium]